MGFLGTFILTNVLSITFYLYLSWPINVPAPPIEKDGFFGHGEIFGDDSEIRPFTVAIAEEKVDKLKSDAAKLLKALTLPENSFEKRLATFLESYEWQQHAHFINTFKHFTTEVEGIRLHFVHVSLDSGDRAKEQRVPILLLPEGVASFWNFFKIIPILSNPKRYGFDFGLKSALVFDVVVTSYPGSLFSDPPSDEGPSKPELARILHKLMSDRLAYDEYVVYGQGGLGTEMASLLSVLFPRSVTAAIVTDPTAPTGGIRRDLQAAVLPGDGLPTKLPSGSPAFPSDGSLLSAIRYFSAEWRRLSGSSGAKFDAQVTIGELATSLALFTLTETVESSSELARRKVPEAFAEATSTVPTCVLSSPESPHHFSRSLLAHKYLNITKYETLEKGGLLYSLRDSSKLAEWIFGYVEVTVMG